MQIPKFLLMIGVAALGLSALQAQKADTVEQTKARELLRKKVAELDSRPPAAGRPTTPAPVNASKSKPATKTDPIALSPSDEAKIREALNQKMAELDAQDTSKSTGLNHGLDPLASPAARLPIPPAVSSAKQQKLTDLLSLYRANVVTPEQYQKMRAEILAQP